MYVVRCNYPVIFTDFFEPFYVVKMMQRQLADDDVVGNVCCLTETSVICDDGVSQSLDRTCVLDVLLVMISA